MKTKDRVSVGPNKVGAALVAALENVETPGGTHKGRPYVALPLGLRAES